MSKARPTSYQKFFWSDYFGDTYTLSGAESGAYLHMIGFYWMTGEPLADDDVAMARITKLPLDEWMAIRPALERFFVIASGLWRHNRIEHDLVEAVQAHDAAVRRGKDAIAKRWGSKKPEAQQVDTSTIAGPATESLYQPKPEPTPEPIKKEKTLAPAALALDGFDDFWAAYSRRDSRRYAEKAWPGALKKVGGDPSVIVRAAKAYSRQFIIGEKSKEFQAMPASWLNGERWTDSSLLKLETPEHSKPTTTMAEDIEEAGRLLRENPPVSMIPAWFKGD